MKIIYNLSCILLLILFQIISSHLYCKVCNSFITTQASFFEYKSPQRLNYLELSETNYTQFFENPYGRKFEVITSKHAELNCENKLYEKDTFFPGYYWSICTCPKCGSRQGWKFTPIESYCYSLEVHNKEECLHRKPFFGIIKENLTSERNKERDFKSIEL